VGLIDGCWSADLAFRISPKSGPMRVMNTLIDANRAITQDLPAGYLKQKPYWRQAGWAVFRAAETGLSANVRAATEALVQAADRESRPWSAAACSTQASTSSESPTSTGAARRPHQPLGLGVALDLEITTDDVIWRHWLGR
jgi:hypothetical protein